MIVRTAATGVYLAGTTNTYQFTKDNTDDAQKYISIKHLSIEKVSSEQSDKGDYAKNAIDGNINTLWHTVYDGSDKEKSITIKLDEPVYLSVLEYVPRQVGTNGRIKDAILYVSDDGEEWTEAASISGWLNNAQSKKIILQDSVKTQYIKFVTTSNWGDGRSFASAAMINLYEDTTKKEPEKPATTEATGVTTTEVTTATEVTTTEKTTAKKETTSSTEKTTEQKTQTSTNKPTQTTTKAPGRATIKTIKKGKRKAQLKWKKVSKAKGYMIQYSTSKKFTST